MKYINFFAFVLILGLVSYSGFGQFKGNRIQSSLRQIDSKVKMLNVKPLNTELNLVNFYDITNSLPKNYKTDGSEDYTKSIQDAINKYDKISFPNFPVLVQGLELHSNMTAYFPSNAKIILKPTTSDRYVVLKLHGVENVSIYNAHIEGDREKHVGKTGEWGYGIDVLCSRNINIYNSNISNCWGDAIVISDSKVNLKSKTGFKTENINVIGFDLDYNRRDAISILGGNKITIKNGIITNTMGTPPKAAIMIEPNNAQAILKNIIISNVKLDNNVTGIGVNLSKFTNNKKGNEIGLTIDSININNGVSGILIAGFNKKPNKLKINGNIKIGNIYSNSVNKRFTQHNGFNIYPQVLIKNFSR